MADSTVLDALRGRARAAAGGRRSTDPHALETLRVGCLALFARMPELPLYRRRDDPAEAAARALLPEVERLLTLAYQLDHVEGAGPWRRALEAHGLVLGSLSVGRLDGLEALASEAWALEQAAGARTRLYHRSDAARRPVYERASGQSRYDPQPEASLQLALLCPWCKAQGTYRSSERVSQETRTCPRCNRTFTTFVGTLRGTDVTRLGASVRRYRYRLDGLAGEPVQIEVEDTSGVDFSSARRDLLAFLYAPPTRLRGVMNLSSSRALWLTSDSACFVATVAFGPDAPELDVLRAFRDDVLARSAPGRAAIAWYYREGPALAEQVRRRPLLRAAIRTALRLTVRLVAWPSQRRPTGRAW